MQLIFFFQVDILKHSVEYIRTLQRILSEYDDFTNGGGELMDPTPSPSTTCSSPSLYPGETESGYGSPPLPHHPVAAISPPVRHAPGNNINSRLSPLINQSPNCLPYPPSHNSEANNLLQTRLSPIGDNNSAVSRRHSFVGDGGDGNFNLNRLSPTGINSCSLQQRLSPRISDPLVFSPQQQQQQQQVRFSPAIQPHMKGGCAAAGDGSMFPGVRPIGKQYTWQVSDETRL
jgi:hypothetical protein